jgi:hypothetical protein
MFLPKERFVFVFNRGVASLLGAAAIVMVLALAGCGGGDDDSTAAEAGSDAVVVKTTSMSKKQYANEAQKICRKETGSVVRIVRKAVVTGEQVRVEAVLPALERMRDKLVALGAPEGQAQQIQEFLAALDEGLEKANSHKSANTVELAGDFESSGQVAAKLGLASCRLG